MRRTLRCVVFTMCLVIVNAGMHAADTVSSRGSQAVVTPTAGESWLHHLHRSFGDTSMGKTARLGPAPSASDEQLAWQLGVLPSSASNIPLHGSDLYRLDCQGCHGEAGLGAPPEINSLIDPVRATSASLLIERMKSRGMEIDSSTAAEMAKQAHQALLQRLQRGGQDMPAFSQLNSAEIQSLLEYLKHLSGVPGAKELTITAAPMRVGELIVKSTCHTCHDATGPNPSPEQLESGAIPPLETLTIRADELQFIRKVTAGAPILMGTPPTLHRGRMPVFYYLSREEAADVYLYLLNYPPTSLVASAPAIAATQQDTTNSTGPTPPHSSAPRPAKADVRETTAEPSQGIPAWAITLMLAAGGGLVLALLGAGFAYAAYELHRLGRNSELRSFQGTAGVAAQRDFSDLVTH